MDQFRALERVAYRDRQGLYRGSATAAMEDRDAVHESCLGRSRFGAATPSLLDVDSDSTSFNIFKRQQDGFAFVHRHCNSDPSLTSHDCYYRASPESDRPSIIVREPDQAVE